ncbi:hypothetical protein, partial [Winogradskyella epiphytica]|uniref:hypothetical protein n=1 Tax=Winogradskyella epiphytica TaxID=262005 RepID=UPI001F21640B
MRLAGANIKPFFITSKLILKKIYLFFSKLILIGNERLKRDTLSLFRGANIEPFFNPTTPFYNLF